MKTPGHWFWSDLAAWAWHYR
ncbi:hypothetical protein [Pseudomonas versuta]